MNSSWRKGLVLPGVFLALWAFHLYSAGGTLVPYRDTGEMVLAGRTLGVAHPPGYPLYALLGKAASRLPLGNPAYRVNLLSAAAAASCGLLIFLILGGGGHPVPALGAVALWAGSPIFRELAAVSEMYTLSLLFLLGVVALVKRRLTAAPSSGEWGLVLFLAGLGLGARTDLVLIAPALLYALWRRATVRQALFAAFLGALGVSVFLYLPFRSLQQPWLDWSDPETLANLAASLLRRSHGGTLDLLSRSYAAGENTLAGLAIFGKGSAEALGGAGVLLALAGLRRLWRESRAYSIFLLLAAAVFGPLFIHLANMPPNPHALAVLEAHFLAPQALLLLMAGEGMISLLPAGSAAGRRAVVALALLLLAGFNARSHAARADKRWNFHARDYATNVLRAARPGSVGALREDVQLFALWERTLVSGKRADVSVVAQGLAASPWYHRMLDQQGRPLPLVGLKTEADWRSLLENLPSRPLWATGDADLPGGTLKTFPSGLILAVESSSAAFVGAGEGTDPLTTFAVRRGIYRQDASPDFFSSDLVTEYSRAALRMAVHWERRDRPDRAEHLLLMAQAFDPEFPSPPFHLGYLRYQQGDLLAAQRHYARSTRLYEEMFRRAAAFRSLPDVLRGLEKEAAEVWVHRGVTAEKLSGREEARQCYLQAVRLDPRSAQAYYNLAVTYWNQDWAAAGAALEKAVALEPLNPAYRRFLDQARRRAS